MRNASHSNAGTTSGFGYFLKGLGLMTKPGVKRFVIIPFLINLFVFAVLIFLFGDWVNELIKAYIPDGTNLPGWLAWLSPVVEIFRSILKIVYYLLALLIMFYTFTFVANLIGAPFNGALSAAVEKHITGHAPPGSDRNIMAEFSVIMLSELKKWLYYFMLAIPLIIVSGILLFIFPPLIGVLWFIFGAWMFSIEYSDYPMGNYGMTFSDIRNEVAKKRMMSLGFGSAVTIGTMVPLFNFIVMPVAVAGATLMRVEQYPLQIENK